MLFKLLVVAAAAAAPLAAAEPSLAEYHQIARSIVARQSSLGACEGVCTPLVTYGHTCLAGTNSDSCSSMCSDETSSAIKTCKGCIGIDAHNVTESAENSMVEGIAALEKACTDAGSGLVSINAASVTNPHSAANETGSPTGQTSVTGSAPAATTTTSGASAGKSFALAGVLVAAGLAALA